MKKKKRKHTRRERQILVLRRSCLTGKVVWLCRAKNRPAANNAYYRAKQAELLLSEKWDSLVDAWRAWLTQVLRAFLDRMAVTDQMADTQVAAARRIQALAREDIPRDTQFLEHIQAEHRFRYEDRIARQNRRMKLAGH